MAYPGGSRPDVQIPTSDITAYSPPRRVETPRVDPRNGITVNPDDLQAFARPAAPQGVMPSPTLPVGGHRRQCEHPFTGPRGGELRWVDSVTDLEGCLACGKTRTIEGWVDNPEWVAAAVAAGVLH